jgi:hypothetical protein
VFLWSITVSSSLGWSEQQLSSLHAAPEQRYWRLQDMQSLLERAAMDSPLLIFLDDVHFMGNLDNYDPAVTDALAAGREVILTDNAGVGLSTGGAPETVAGRTGSVFVIARFRVADYETWKAAFDDHVEARIRHGAIGHRVFRVETRTHSQSWSSSPRTEERRVIRDDVSTLHAICRGGVEGGPHDVEWQLDYVDQVDVADYSTLPFS